MAVRVVTLSRESAAPGAPQLAQSLHVPAGSWTTQVRPLLPEKIRRLAGRVENSRLDDAVHKHVLETIQGLTAYLDRG
jgi:hypothetical protein